ncbi:type VI secretion system membrane subunit TssM [Undibacterium sp. Jales W-56]|uniref:type VI secretion system membrane subunit TssM n=1 Tax=Undibacterium sp. Jales W-56 TaxID=2897325 RepID=UPI0021D2CC3C|nr:type VI secretion system membrane subunit TssM [Undibacterium sp. Jales W-56]MCU6432918.1 type VI secretion system membrane subunit TssM [Undibacterium sp. Jales W-56]
MHRIWQFLTDKRTLVVIGFVALAAFLFLSADLLQISMLWAAIVFSMVLLTYLGYQLLLRGREKRSSQQFGQMLEQQVDKPGKSIDANKTEVDWIRKRMLDAITTIKTSKLGLVSGEAALYELPWYMILGNPAAGKSTAIINSGLQFPFADKSGKIVQGVGGTRNCDWFFTTNGIVLDTAGRYSVNEEDRGEWFGFLDLLKKYRKRAPINGIIIAVSITDLTGNRPEFGINLAKNLRQRVQELTERLEVFAPVYVVFTKADLIAGFSEFFLDSERTERDRVWGATLPYNLKSGNQDMLHFFDERFDELYDGLKEMSLASMSLNRGDRMPPGVFTFPLEFASIKNPLRAFIATLFEENPFQFKPIFRGFYFTSALQEGASVSASSERIAQRFDLKMKAQPKAEISSQHGFFLLDLFRKVIFADKDLVAQYASRNKIKLRYTTFFAATILVGLLLGSWSWSYLGNRQLVANVQADLDKVIKLQEKRIDLQSRFEALEILQDRIEQLNQYRTDRPWSLSMGLYQGDILERKLREEYFSGMKEVMLKPVAGNLEVFLAEMNANAGKLEPMTKTPQFAGVSTTAVASSTVISGAASTTVTASANAQSGPVATANNTNLAQQFKDASPTNVEDAYNALKTYLMLGDKTRAESSHLNDQLTRFWRVWLESNRGAMSREQMIRSAERMIDFYLTQMSDPSWPQIENKLTLVDQSRENLRRVVKGLPARDRVYADVKARASTRFPAITVAKIVGDENKELVVGSYAVPGTFTRDAWKNFVQEAFKDAANKELQSADWVLKTASKDDLTLEGSPEQIQKSLVEMYKTEYAREWKKFVQGISVAELSSFDSAVVAMNRLGDPQTSPINKIVTSIYQETSWDNPSLLNDSLSRAQKGIVGWFKETILRQNPTPVNVSLDINAPKTEIPMGPVGREFSGVARLVGGKEKDASLMRGYMDALSKLRSRFNQLKNQGDTGPGAKQLMQQTLEGGNSELAEALKYVDEQMLTGMTDEQKTAIRPLLVRPLIQSFAVIVKPSEMEVNKTWVAQVYEPFQKTLAGKYPFTPDSKIEASNSEIGQIFGPEGAIAKFANTSMGALIVRRGDTLAPKTWANMGISLIPQVVTSFPGWVAPLSAGGVASATGAEAQTVFQIQPLPVPGTLEYTIEIDGQQLRYRNTPAQWTNMIWPNPQGTPGARITAVTFDGKTIELLNQPGRFGLERMINTASRKRKDGGVFELSWTNSNITVALNLRTISSPQTAAGSNSPQGQGFRGVKLPESIVGGAPTMSGSPNPSNVSSTVTSISVAATVAGGK